MADPLVKNAVPLPATRDMMKEAIRDGAREWNTASVGFSFGELQSSNLDLADVVVQGLSTESNGFEDKCAGPNKLIIAAVACAERAGEYPHLGKATIYFEYPPKTRSGVYEWTSNASLAAKTVQCITYLYMPVYMAHEFAHTAGLEHPATTDDAMSPFPTATALTDNDKKAMENTYNVHAAH